MIRVLLVGVVSLVGFEVGHARGPQTERLYESLMSQGVYKKADVLALLPQEMKDNFVLVNDSQSRQKGTFELPRVLHFTKTADFIVTSSGHTPENDIAGNDLEILEFDRIQNQWIVATIHLQDSKVSKPVYNSKQCLSCHGLNPRPIWGAYPNWPTSYGGTFVNSPDKMGPDEKIKFLKFVELAKSHEAYKHLNIILTSNGYAFPSVYPLPNSVFTARLANLHINYLFSKIINQNEASHLKYNFLTRIFACTEIESLRFKIENLYAEKLKQDVEFQKLWASKPEAIDEETKLFRLLGVDPTEDIDLALISNYRKPIPGLTAMNWSAGSDYLGDMLSFKILNTLVKDDPSLSEVFSEVLPLMAKIEHMTFELSNEEVSRLDNKETKIEYRSTLYPFLRYNIYYSVLGNKKEALCKIAKENALEMPKLK